MIFGKMHIRHVGAKGFCFSVFTKRLTSLMPVQDLAYEKLKLCHCCQVQVERFPWHCICYRRSLPNFPLLPPQRPPMFSSRRYHRRQLLRIASSQGLRLKHKKGNDKRERWISVDDHGSRCYFLWRVVNIIFKDGLRLSPGRSCK